MCSKNVIPQSTIFPSFFPQSTIFNSHSCEYQVRRIMLKKSSKDLGNRMKDQWTLRLKVRFETFSLYYWKTQFDWIYHKSKSVSRQLLHFVQLCHQKKIPALPPYTNFRFQYKIRLIIQCTSRKSEIKNV